MVLIICGTVVVAFLTHHVLFMFSHSLCLLNLSQLIVVFRQLYYGDNSASFELLLWRALCDLGIGVRMLLFSVFSLQLCGKTVCHRPFSGEFTTFFPLVTVLSRVNFSN
jgi:hypothetical protein